MKALRIIKQIAQSTYTQVKRRCTKRHTTAASMKMRLTKHMEPNLHKMEQVAKINLRLSLTQSKEMHPEMFETKHHPMEMTPVQIPNTDGQKKSTQRKNENTKRINKKIAGSRARIMLSRVLDEMGSRLYQEQPLQGKLPRLGGNILNRLQHQKTDLHNNSKKTNHEYSMQLSTGNDFLTESIQRERDTRFPHPHRYPRARESNSEYAAILDDYAELYKIRITIPEEQVAMLSRELKTIKGQVVDIQSRLDDTFASVLRYMEEGKQDVRQLVSSMQGISSNMSAFYKDVDTRLRDANEQMSTKQLSLKAGPEQQHNDTAILELFDAHLKTTLKSCLPAYLQSCQTYPPLDGKVNTNEAGGYCEAVDPMAVSVRQLRAPLPLTDTSSVEEKYKILEQKYNRALVTIKAMRLTAGLDCVPVSTEADYLEFLRELESRAGPINREFSKGRYMLKIRGINDDTDAYVGILDVTSDDNILLRHRQLPDTLSSDTSEQLKKDMVMRINDMSYVVHEIYESLLPPPSTDNE